MTETARRSTVAEMADSYARPREWPQALDFLDTLPRSSTLALIRAVAQW